MENHWQNRANFFPSRFARCDRRVWKAKISFFLVWTQKAIWRKIFLGGWTQFCERSAVTRVTARVLNQTENMAAKKAMVHRRRFFKIYSLKFCDIWWNFYFYLILNNENLIKMEVEQTNFETHLIITVQLYYWLSKNPSVKIWSNKFQMVMINYSKLCASL